MDNFLLALPNVNNNYYNTILFTVKEYYVFIMTEFSKLTAPTLSLKPGMRTHWGRLYGSSYGLILSNTAKTHSGPIIVITPDTPTATRLEQECRFFAHNTMPVLSFPDWETLPYDAFSPHQDIISDRLSTLYHLPDLKAGILIIPIATVLNRLSPKTYLNSNSLVLDLAQKLDIDTMRQRLTLSGYHLVSQVMEHGEFAVRGSIIDLFPMGSKLPFRVELFDDEIESIRTFDIENQQSIEKVDHIKLLPAREFPFDEAAITQFRNAYRKKFEGDPQSSQIYRDISNSVTPPGIEYYLPLFFDTTDTIFDYFPANCIVITIEQISESATSFWNDVADRYEQRRHDQERPILPPQEIFLRENELFENIKHFPQINIQSFKIEDKQGNYNYNTLSPTSLTLDIRAQNPGEKLLSFINSFPGKILFTAESMGRKESLLDVLKGCGVHPTSVNSWDDFLNSENTLNISVAYLENGLITESPSIAIITEQQLLGERVLQHRRRKKRNRNSDAVIANLVELDIGAPVVHEEHGVGRYLGLHKITVGDIEQEFLMLNYFADDKLYVPVSSLHFISRYTGSAPETAPLHKLGSQQWEKAQRRARERVRDVAAELLDIYARRKARQGYKYHIDQDQYNSFANAFPFEETPDQEDAIISVIEDMKSGLPMDRLVCGDVGFGKTEVAMRAAFIAVQDGKQVAMLVPTTLLAQQHFDNFQDRFADWPIQIDSISRFKNKKDQDSSVINLRMGKTDVIIGTHKLLQKDLKFKRLGLVIIDEEHRFGVRQKERFKALRSEVDLLTLTATPIPRTLNMSLSGIRDLSIIATPPAKRLAIKTFISQWNETTIKEACTREIRRGGQVFFLHNKVDSIEKTAKNIADLVPDASVAVAHGQLREKELEHIMAEFYHHKHNILVCTTIIETGIDVPNANTIIIDRADKFGLAQLYQLRGRVGRSHHQAYAFLVVPPRKAMTANAVKRLEAIESIEDLGTGFTLATHDLEIRGAGELLGDDQSGQIHEIGFTLYTELLDRAVEALKSGKQPELDQPLDHGAEVNLGASALIPDDFIPDVHTRLIMYKRIASAKNNSELRELQVEMIDRFGLLPESTKNLFLVTELKIAANPIGIKKIEFGIDNGQVIFNANPKINTGAIIDLIQTKPNVYVMDGPEKIRITKDMPKLEDRFNIIESFLNAIKC